MTPTAARVSEAVFGLVTSIPSGTTQPVKDKFWFLYTFTWDLGLYFIVFAQLRSLWSVLRWRQSMAREALLYVWLFVMFVALVLGSAFAGLYAFSADQARDGVFNRASAVLLWLAFGAFVVSLLGTAVAFAHALIVRRRDGVRFTSADRAVCIAFFPILTLLVIRLVPDILRIVLYRSPEVPVYIGMQLVPEAVATAIAICTAHLVTHWHAARDTDAAELRAHKKEVWARHLDDAISYAQAARQKGADIEHRKKPWIMFVAETRMFGDEATGLAPNSDRGRVEAVNLLVRLKSLSAVIADNLVLVPDLKRPLLRREERQPDIDMRATEARVAEELPGLFGLTAERARTVARDWVIIFVLDWRTLA